MNSIGKVLTNFEWECDSTISMAFGTGYQGKGISRTLFLSPKLEEIPENLFAVKLSQSTNAAKAGKIVFKWFSFRFQTDAKFENLAPTGITLETPLADVKNMVVSKLANIPNAEISLSIPLHGRFTNIQCSDDLWALYDEEKFPNADPNKHGRAPYYVKSDALIHVKLKGAVSVQNEYMQVTLSTTATSKDIFQAVQQGKVWSPDGTGASYEAPAEPAAPVSEAGSKAVW